MLKINPDLLKRDFAAITANSAEAAGSAALRRQPAKAAASGDGCADAAPRWRRRAGSVHHRPDRAGEGRARSIRSSAATAKSARSIDILTRRRQNNPILTGEAGVGKTAVVEGFALRLASGDVPPALQGVTLRTLDLGLLQAGAGVKGEFENRLRGVIDEVKASARSRSSCSSTKRIS